jgi:signal transduction histidine kinase/ligand-binding sensor domain-containing protein
MVASKALRLLLGAAAGLLAGLPRPGRAQEVELPFVRYTTEQGLSRDGVTALAKDRRGFLWVGTTSGLNRFDGVQFKVYKRTGRAGELPSNYILYNGLVPDSLGQLWVSTTRGLCRFDPVRERAHAVPVPELRDARTDNDQLSPICFDRAGQGWFASGTRLYRVDPRTLRLTAFALPFAAANDYFPSPLIDAAGRLWLAWRGAAYRFDPATGRCTYYLGQDAGHPQAPPVQNLSRGGGAALYALTAQGTLRYDAATDRFAPGVPGVFPAVEVAEATGPDGQPLLWLSSLDRLTRYEPGTQQLTHFRPLPDDVHSYPGGEPGALLHDGRTGILWVGTARGLALLDLRAVAFRRQPVRSPDRSRYPEDVQTVMQDHADDSLYWVLTKQTGLWRWQRGRLGPVAHPAALGSRWRGLYQDAGGRLWMTLSHGLAVYDPATGRWQRRGTALPPPARPILLYGDRQARLWVGTYEQGLYWYDGAADALRPFPLPVGAVDGYTVRGLQQDDRGRLWVLTSRGLFRIAADRRRVQALPIHTDVVGLALSDAVQSTFLLDRQQRLWLSGIGFLLRADTTGRVRRAYTLATGLRADQVFGITADRRGHLWLATDEQVHELDPATGRFQYYDQGNGLLINSLYQNFTTNRQGELFLGGQGGFNYFQPNQLHRPLPPPPVSITDVLVNNQPRLPSSAQAVDLRPGETTLTVDFAALNFNQARKNRYAYRLLGFDANWTETGARTATYTNLPPGTYWLRVRAANSDGVWNLTGQTLTVRVHQAYYQTWWFRAGLLGLLLAAGWGVYRYREGQRRQLARVRDHIAKDLHDDMGSTLSSIRIFSEVAQAQLAGQHPQTAAILQRISQNASTLAESMQDIIWTIKPQQDGLADVVSRMREFGLRLTEAKGIAFEMQETEPFPALTLSLEQRRNVYLIFKETVNNAVKYAECTQLTVQLRVHGRQLHLRIADNGRGFDPATERIGNGLANLRARARDIGGQAILTSAPAAGTVLELTAPLS